MSAGGGISELMEQMAAAGAPLEAILLAVKAIEARDALEADRRARAAEKKRSERERKRLSRDCPATVVATPQSAPNDIYSNPLCDTPVSAKASTAPRGRSERGSKIPEDWTAPPIAELSEEARKLAERWPAAAYRAEAEAFRNYWLAETGAKARKSNWNRAWANRIVAVNGRVMREAKFAPVQPTSIRPASSRPRTAADWEQAAEFREEQGDHAKAAEYREEARRLRATVPPGTSVGELARGLARRVGNG